ncbi:MAG: TetR/AcrR family transcriptional regulator [Myxococcota bacterium]
MARPVGADRERTRQKILDAACDHLVDVGIIDFSTRKVAKHAGVSVSVVFHYFPTRRDLVNACIDTVYHHLESNGVTFRDSFHAASDPKELIRNTVRDGLRFAQTNRKFLRALIILAMTDGITHREKSTQTFLTAVASHVAKTVDIAPHEARLRVQSLIYLVARYAANATPQLESLTETPDTDAQQIRVETHLTDLAVSLLTA